MYRVLAANSEVRERRDQLRHPRYAPPELLATRPNQLWSWDITKLLGPAKWTYYYLYVIIDVFSRYTVGWMVAHRESASLAERLIEETCQRERIPAGQLTIHADRGTSMTSKPVALLLSDLGVTKSHSRPHVSNDNPYSEAQFKTLKYRPAFPERFGSLEDSRGACGDFFDWYNLEHHHSGLGLLTPHDVHHGLAQARIEGRAATLAGAFREHPRTLRARPASASRPAHRSMDQQAQAARATCACSFWKRDGHGRCEERSNSSVNRMNRCLIIVDRFRCSPRSSSSTMRQGRTRASASNNPFLARHSSPVASSRAPSSTAFTMTTAEQPTLLGSDLQGRSP